MRQYRFAVCLLAILLAAFALRAWGINEQPLLDDESLTAVSADNYMERGQLGPIMPFHPHLRDILINSSTRVFGRGAWGLRGPSIFMGSLGVLLLGLLVRRLTRNDTASLAAALILAFDPVHITFSRQSIQEVHTVFFFLAGCLAFFSSYEDDEIKWPWLTVFSGVAFGLGMASKAHAAFPLMTCFSVGVYRALKIERFSDMALVATSLVLLPFAVYVLTFLPWFGRGYRMGEWFYMQGELAEKMVTHSGYSTSIMIDYRPWKWFLKPLMGYGNFTARGSELFITLAVGNPLVWMLVLPSALYVSFRARVEQNQTLFVIILLFVISYIPLALSPRPIWLLSSLAVTPFAFSLVAYAVVRLARRKRGLLASYLALVIIGGIAFYPLSTGKATKYPYLSFMVDKLNPHDNRLIKGDMEGAQENTEAP